MADALYYVDVGGPTLTEVRAPFGTPPAELKALARLKGKPLVPSPEGAPRPSPGFQREQKPIAPGEGGVLSSLERVLGAAKRGFTEPRQNDPWGINPENRSPFALLNAPYDLARGALELGESVYGGLKQATGQGIWETGVSKDRPERIAAQLFEPIEVASAAMPISPLSSLRLAPARTAARTPGLQLLEAADRQGVTLMPADVGGDLTRMFTGLASGSVFGGPVRRASTRKAEQLGNAASRASSKLGEVVPDITAGQDVIEGGRSYISRTSDTANELYKRAEALAPDLRVMATDAISAIDKELAAAAASNDTTSPFVRELQRYRDRLADPNGLSVAGISRVIREAKSAGRQEEALRGTNFNRVMRNVAALAEDETLDFLRETGHSRAARAYRNANDYWRTRVETIDNVLTPVMGPGKSGEAVLSSIEEMARGKKGGVARLGDLLNTIPREAQSDVRATIVDRLGRVETADGYVFSPENFLKNYTKMSREGRRALFGSNPQVQRDLNDIARLAESQRNTAKFGNPPGTGRAIEAGTLLTGAATAVTTGNPTYALGVAALAGMGSGSARLLASPRFVRLLAGAKNANTSAAQRTFREGLKNLAAREPALAGPLQEFNESLQSSAPAATGEKPIPEVPRDLSVYENMSDAELEALAQPVLSEDPYEKMTDEELETLANGSKPTVAPSGPLGR